MLAPRPLVAAAVLVLAVSGCGDDPEVTVGVAEGIPAGFPEAMPLPDDADVQGMYSERDGSLSYLVSASTDLDLPGLAAFYDDRLPARGWEVAQRLQSADGLTLTVVGHGYQAIVALSDEDGTASVLITLAPE